MSIAYLYDHHPLADSTGCIARWRAVIYQALCDSCYQFFDAFMMEKHSLANAGPQYISPANWRYAQDARRFLLSEERGFRDICAFADIDSDYLRRRPRRVINDVDLIVDAALHCLWVRVFALTVYLGWTRCLRISEALRPK